MSQDKNKKKKIRGTQINEYIYNGMSKDDRKKASKFKRTKDSHV